MQALTKAFTTAHRELDARDREILRACSVARRKGLTGHAAVEYAKAEREPREETGIAITRRFCDTPPRCIDDESMRTAAEEPGPLVLTGQGDFQRGFTPTIRSTGRRRASVYRWLVGAVIAVTYPWWSKGF